MIAYSNTIIDPGTVMIKAFYTLIADTAMTRPLSSYDLTIRAKQYWVKIFKHRLNNIEIRIHKSYQERDVFRLFKVTWICGC
jgi:hypothetical protein